MTSTLPDVIDWDFYFDTPIRKLLKVQEVHGGNELDRQKYIFRYFIYFLRFLMHQGADRALKFRIMLSDLMHLCQKTNVVES